MRFKFFRKKRKSIAEMTTDEVTAHVNSLCECVKEICKPDPTPMELLHRWKGEI